MRGNFKLFSLIFLFIFQFMSAKGNWQVLSQQIDEACSFFDCFQLLRIVGYNFIVR